MTGGQFQNRPPIVIFEEKLILIPYIPLDIPAEVQTIPVKPIQLEFEYQKPVLIAATKPYESKEPTEKPTEACEWRMAEASWYGDPNGYLDPFHGRTAANGSRFNTWHNTVAHKTLPFGTSLLIRSGDGSTSVQATVTDRGPFIGDREFDLSYNLANSALVETAQGQKTLLQTGVGYIEVCL